MRHTIPKNPSNGRIAGEVLSLFDKSDIKKRLPAGKTIPNSIVDDSCPSWGLETSAAKQLGENWIYGWSDDITNVVEGYPDDPLMWVLPHGVVDFWVEAEVEKLSPDTDVELDIVLDFTPKSSRHVTLKITDRQKATPDPGPAEFWIDPTE